MENSLRWTLAAIVSNGEKGLELFFFFFVRSFFIGDFRGRL
jgi:hypothetical protein